MAKRNVGGRPTIFGIRDGATVNGRLTKYGTAKLEAGRLELAKLAGWEPEKVSDADVVEFFARGQFDTIAFLKAKGIHQ